ncbi:MAG: Asp23/Gls24 family envelope stress response protein [Phototrophicales bacterium]|nr:MAG: Asp23/Gls24 family envelope stress response protein [Phototrophicales bacterium]
MALQQNELGTVHISETAIANLASHAVTQTYGVVGMTTPNLASDIAATITRDPHRGVVVSIKENAITIDLYVVLAHGIRITSVATSIINSVRYLVEKHVGLPVEQINVHVQGLRIEKEKSSSTATR